ncbi:MAG: biosynthetic-type acetolactate synthase large subunit [Chloroflexi bacterium AL-W]|nr:biosynthetic-type acetolactate synthase large subunit [Chloroflexi bacterium AL-N1]NOK67526.1 biosynthetic-type acetolactate synthase large subunit [Chloroflexi bacterium AL-N10]NOK74982.1 biosynthetic-type acetolactate synthase large subunit [Chloroflexi bacterium AL-N5]NOK81769.1 biosynthetic-type acetolactate synthase large subunit [Chloroflexi bacterium AL-W]NOK89615.1 biosynthetic-type acetolactate synthase large subunit [Chloroflexi bacterium AL-N15]
MSEERTGAQIMCEALIREGVDVMFGIPGGAIMPFYYAMWEYREQLRHILCRHEQGAGHAAEGYARTTGRVGVCIGTSGPGATNLVTPIADAMMDSTPLLAITGQVGSHVLGKDAFQETDITGITMPITKHNYLVKNVDELAYVIKEAIHIATTGRPGPVLVDITKDAQIARTIPVWDQQINLPGYKPTYTGNRKQIREAIKLLANAKKPLIMAGNGVIMANASEELRAFAERTRIPVITTLHGIGSFPEDHPLSIGMPGMHGWVHVNRAIQECDVLFNIGGRFDDRVTGKASTFAPNAQVIHVDIDPSEIGKNVKVTVPVVGDARVVLQALLEDLPDQAELAALYGNASDWMEHIREMQSKHQHKQQYLNRPDTSQLMPHDVYDAMTRILNDRGNYRIATDVGQHQMWAAQLIDWYSPRTHITSGGAGTMGFAVPAAMGVAVAHPNDVVWAIAGDGGFQMTNQEMATIVQEGIKNVKVAVINNGYLGMVRQWQELFENKRYSGTPLSGPDFARLAEAYGWKGITVEQMDQVEGAINEAYAHDGPVLIDFRVEREVNVFPMVPQNKGIHEMLTEAPESETVTT